MNCHNLIHYQHKVKSAQIILKRSEGKLINFFSTDLQELILVSYKEGMCEGFHNEKSLKHHLVIDIIRSSSNFSSSEN